MDSDTLNVQSLNVATPERVALKLPVAGVGHRALAYLVDAGAIFGFWVVVSLAASFFTNLIDDFQALSSIGRALSIFGVFATQWCYWTLFEIAWDGQTPGKRALRIRVVSADGSPVTALASVLRNLCRFLDFLPVAYAAGLICMLLSKENRRIGDLVAGTLLVRAERIDLSRYVPVATVVEPAQRAGASSLSPEEQELVLAFLSRAPTLEPKARAALARRITEQLGAGLDEPTRQRLSALS